MKSSKNKSVVPTDKSGPRIRHDFIRGEIFSLFFFFIVLSFWACGSSEIKPVDIYPEDMCSQCRMAISDQSFAAEIITEAEEVYKFDDLGCMEKFKEKSGELKIAARFVKDYETQNWIPFARSVIVQTGLKTPMSSGKAAFADSNKAQEYLTKFPKNL
jgi:copper chaperone NosL